MTIQGYPYYQQEEKELLDFLNCRHYNYKSGGEKEIADIEFLNQYNKELDEAEAQIDAGDYLTHDEVKKFFFLWHNKTKSVFLSYMCFLYFS